MNRRHFIQNSSLTVASGLLFNQPLNFKKKSQFGLQLYSVRDLLKTNSLNTLKDISKIGYNYVEGYGYSNRKWQGTGDVNQTKTMLADSGLKMPSAHFVLKISDYDFTKKDFSENIKHTLNDALAVGQKYFVSSSIINEDKKDADTFKKLCEVFNKTGEYFSKNGLKLGYHNHDSEFTSFGDSTMMDMMLKEVDAKNLTIEMDMGWVVYANQNPVEWYKKYPHRFELSHLKDGNKKSVSKTEFKSVVIGKGDVDFKSILENHTLGGLKMYIVEIEDYVVSPIADAKACLENIKKLGF